MAIEVVNRQRLVQVDRRSIASIAGAALEEVGRAGAAVTIAFVRDPAIRRLNLDYRGKDQATDVLSFPATDDEIEPDQSDSAGYDSVGEDYLGDIVISADTALRQAEEAGITFEREASELVIHGVLHLCGYDHERDEGQMNRLELRIRRKLMGE